MHTGIPNPDNIKIVLTIGSRQHTPEDGTAPAPLCLEQAAAAAPFVPSQK